MLLALCQQLKLLVLILIPTIPAKKLNRKTKLAGMNLQVETNLYIEFHKYLFDCRGRRYPIYCIKYLPIYIIN